jgi:N-methylhydantoinase A/oxoprolinase/acetone carboxylase beta subunit
MVVKDDGSLVSKELARKKPIETMVSGPAASLLGAGILGRGFLKTDEKDLWVMDVGGTTTDMAVVENGRPVVSPNGARVGQWKTMATVVETRIRGLGSDSLVAFGLDGRIVLGPHRVLPLCRLAARWPEVTGRLSDQKNTGLPATLAGVFFLPGAPADSSLNHDETDILKSLERETPLPLAVNAENCFKSGRRFGGLAAFSHPAVLVSAFTPTDAMSILGLYHQGEREAAVLGARILGHSLRLEPDELATRVLEEFSRLLAMEIVSYGFDGEGVAYDDVQFAAKGILRAAFGLLVPGRVKVKLGNRSPSAASGRIVGGAGPFSGAWPRRARAGASVRVEEGKWI